MTPMMSRGAIASLNKASWPPLLAALAFALGLLMLGAAVHLGHQADRVVASTREIAAGRSHLENQSKQQLPAADVVAQLPDDDSHLEDLRLLLRLANEHGVRLGTIEYRLQRNASLPILVHSLDLRLNEEYPKLKEFVADVVQEIPNAYLEEIQVEHASATASKVQVALKLSFAYKQVAKNALGATAGRSGEGSRPAGEVTRP
jgi:hypothetical protein